MRREWKCERVDSLDGFARMLGALIEDLKLMTPEEKAALKGEKIGDAFVIYLE